MENKIFQTDVTLSQYADGLLCILYRKYRARIKGVYSDAKAKKFSFGEFQSFASKYICGDIIEICNELKDLNMLNFTVYDNMIYFMYLQDDAIDFMERRCTNSHFDLGKQISNSFFE